MKLREILNEDSTDIVARFYKEAGRKFDQFYNPEDVKYKDKTGDYYKKHFKGWFNEGIVPIFEKPTDKPQPEYTVQPKEGKLQSPGYRGLQYALAKAGLPYNHSVQRYEPNISQMLATQTMDGARNNNSQ